MLYSYTVSHAFYLVQCDTPTWLTNGFYTLSSTIEVLGTVVNYQCDPGFEHSSGDMVRICAWRGIWTGMSPTCSGRLS